MSAATSTSVHYVQGQHKSAVDRHALRTAEDSATFLLPLLAAAPPDFKLLDLGCGPGSITTDLARRFPQASFTGIDSGEIVVAKARDLAKARGTANTVFHVGDITKLDPTVIENGTFDFVYCHQVLVHMQDPVAGLKAMKAAAKPAGGVVAAREADLVGGTPFYPDTKGTRCFKEDMEKLLRLNGSNPDMGRRLVSAAMQAGWTRDQIKSSSGVNSLDTYEQRKQWYDSIIETLSSSDAPTRQRLISKGLRTEAEINEIVEGMHEWFAAEDAWGAFLSGEILCTNN